MGLVGYMPKPSFARKLANGRDTNVRLTYGTLLPLVEETVGTKERVLCLRVCAFRFLPKAAGCVEAFVGLRLSLLLIVQRVLLFLGLN